MEDWSVKHIKLRSKSLAHNNAMPQRAPAVTSNRRLPPMRNTVKALPPKIVTNVMKNHYRTQEILVESSRRAGREVTKSSDACNRARMTLNEWTEAQEHFKDICEKRIEQEMQRSPCRYRMWGMSTSRSPSISPSRSPSRRSPSKSPLRQSSPMRAGSKRISR